MVVFCGNELSATVGDISNVLFYFDAVTAGVVMAQADCDTAPTDCPLTVHDR